MWLCSAQPSLFFLFYFDGTPILFLHISSSSVKIRLYTENQLPRLPGSALKVPVVGGWVPTHYKVMLQLMLRLSWAVTIVIADEENRLADGEEVMIASTDETGLLAAEKEARISESEYKINANEEEAIVDEEKT